MPPTLTLGPGTYDVTGDTFVLEGGKLILLPGTTLSFYPGATLTVSGELVAVGSTDNHITLTAFNKTNKWGVLQFTENAVPSTLTNDGDYISGK